MANRRKYKLVSVGLVLALCVGLLAGCGAMGFLKKGKALESDRKKKVVLIAKSTESEFWKSVFSGANAASTEYNMELMTRGPKNEEDYQTQNDMIEEAVSDGADAIIFSAIDYEENAEAINAAAQKGVKIIVIDSDVNSNRVECRIGTDNYEAGQMAGEAALAGEEDKIYVGVVNFDKVSENGQTREQGMKDALKKDERATIVESVNARSTIDSAKSATLRMLEEHPEINVLVTFNEWTSLGVGYAIQELEAGDRIRVVAFDSNVISVDMLESGEVDALIVQNPYAMGYIGVESAYKVLNGYAITEKDIDIETQLVMKENMYSEACQRMLFTFEENR